MRGQPLLSRDY